MTILYHRIDIKTPVWVQSLNPLCAITWAIKRTVCHFFPPYEKTLIFLSYFCFSFKVYHALQQAIEQSRDSIILIFLQDIQDYKLYHALHLRRGMFRSSCILNWPAQKERVSAFHQQLVMALKSNSKVNWILKVQIWIKSFNCIFSIIGKLTSLQEDLKKCVMLERFVKSHYNLNLLVYINVFTEILIHQHWGDMLKWIMIDSHFSLCIKNVVEILKSTENDWCSRKNVHLM